jgi:hypothetical protein
MVDIAPAMTMRFITMATLPFREDSQKYPSSKVFEKKIMQLVILL